MQKLFKHLRGRQEKEKEEIKEMQNRKPKLSGRFKS